MRRRFGLKTLLGVVLVSALAAFIVSRVYRRWHEFRLSGPLYVAAEQGDQAAVQALLDSGANVNTLPMGLGGPLLAAVNNQDRQMIRLLLDHGADPNAWSGHGWHNIDDPESHSERNVPYTPFTRAIMGGDLSSVRMFINNNARITPDVLFVAGSERDDHPEIYELVSQASAE